MEPDGMTAAARDRKDDPGSFFPSLVQLRAFTEVARLDSITRASEELRRSQSAITQAIHNLEAELDVSLLTRTSTGSYLTDVGRILQGRAEACFARIDLGFKDMLDGQSGVDETRVAAIARRVTKSQILALIAVDEHGSFAQAARHVHGSLTSLHRSARSLEEQLGRKLFKNAAQGATTNEAGGRLADYFRLAVRELEAAKEEISALKGVITGRLMIGTLLLSGSNLMSLELSHLGPRYRDLMINMINGGYEDLVSKLRGGSIDLFVGVLKNRSGANDLVEEALDYDPYLIAVREDHPLARKEQVTLADLRSSEWIMSRISANRRAVLEGIFKDNAFPYYSVETHSLLTIFVLLGSADRMALLTRSELALAAELGTRLTALDYAIDEPPAVLGLTFRRDWQPTSIQREFLDFLRSRARERQSMQAENSEGRSSPG